MIFEQFSKRSGNLLAYKYDFGVCVTFKTNDDDIPFTVGDELRFELQTGIKDQPMIQKTFLVDTADYSFDLVFTQVESDMLANSGRSAFLYTIKQYSSSGRFLDTIMNGKLLLQETLKWED